MEITEITEQSNWNLEPKDKTIKNVCLLGSKSKNGRTYTPKAIQDAARIFAGARIQEMHTQDHKPRKPSEYLGLVGETYVKGGKVYAKEIRIASDHDYSRLSFMAENDPSAVGISIEGKCNYDKKTNMVMDMLEGGTVAMVCNPAATKSLFESTNIEEDMEIKEQLNQVSTELDALKKTNADLTKLVEALSKDLLPTNISKLLTKLDPDESKILIEEFKIKQTNTIKPKSDPKSDVKTVGSSLHESLIGSFK